MQLVDMMSRTQKGPSGLIRLHGLQDAGDKAVVRKAGSGRRKVRAVVCGNQLSGKETKEEVFAGGADSVALRATLRKALFEQRKVGTVDVKTTGRSCWW